MNTFKKLSLACGLLAIASAPVFTASAHTMKNLAVNTQKAWLFTAAMVTLGCFGLTKSIDKATHASSKIVNKHVIDKQKRPGLHKLTTGLLVTTCSVACIQMVRTLQGYLGADNLWESNLQRLGLEQYMWEVACNCPPTPPADTTAPDADTKDTKKEQL